MELGLENVHVLITGASGGIGLETAEVFYGKCAIVTAHYNTNFKPLENFASSRSQAIKADLTKEDEVIQLFESAEKLYGPVQILVINHAIHAAETNYLWDMSLDQWKCTIDSNLTSSFLVAREYMRHLKKMSVDLKDDASIILIGSTAGKYGEAGHADYAASKSAMMYGLTMTLKNEIVKIAPKARVNCIGPGWVKTPMVAELLKDPNVTYAALATTPLKKVAMPGDIANQIVVLSSNKISGHVTGQVLMVEGGMEGRLLNKPEDIGITF
ncbi:hypothetical protein NLJ89_g2981 [Agrocybe chaxingu]|uniref:Uncharacterized protein n=1 Tax=Agrocybe chaxingu TaxID=84603 RepID=A0A9W8K5J3_9AGAR|nr:hypothetical protein NLJ89_g2981 [Agrocybe chaxingu]